ncbi:DNA repair ATPase [Phytoactinopolyspora halotolerans]|uniref:AAA domain-containing protein n=1 Tax=Phytoactinopolyspora halotolerans TaxID=1981512 RepID=A0A6L9SIV8_9ACTN|nr:DNA repair ATPase [Phytoactinopolyspora halotolerans]NEE04221.1 AAA domain-containing protein [Phytoactinopolyspora halotolerans]
MTETATDTPAETGAAGDAQHNTLDAGTYEILRSRLRERAAELASRAETLNAGRIDVFGGTQLELIGTERIRTENNCVPRDIVSLGGAGPTIRRRAGVAADGEYTDSSGAGADAGARTTGTGGLMLFGYNVFVGLRQETTVADVFSLHEFSRSTDATSGSGSAPPAFRFDDVDVSDVTGLIDTEKFQRDFSDMYRYFQQTRLLQLRRTEDKLLAVFQTGPSIDDLRVLRWRLAVDGTIAYQDNRGDRDHAFGPSHDFEWIETTRDDHVTGRHPHISIEDLVFVETTGGELTLKVENNTETGQGIYTEPVDDPLQSLADADVHYARLGVLVLLRIRPYNETTWRYLVFNSRTKDVTRLDGIGQACRQLPEDHGIIFPGGYYLTTGEYKTFDADVSDLEYKRTITSPNGEDVLYVFHARDEGRSLLLPYNVIRKEVSTPIPCHGYSLFDDGTMVILRATSAEPTRVHPLQVWQTPFQSDTYAAAQPVGTGPLERIGNAELVRGISDCLSITRMIGEMAPSAAVFEAIIAACARAFDSYHWLGEPDLGDLRTPLTEIRATAEQVLDEFENVQALTAQATAALEETETDVASLIRRVRGEAPRSAQQWVTQLAELRRAKGHLVTLRDMRYIDGSRLDTLDTSLDDELASAAERAVEFLQREDAFAAYHQEVESLVEQAETIPTVSDATVVGERMAEQSQALETVTEVIGSLDIADATMRTAILERIGEVLGGLNRARATLEGRRRDLLATEGRAEFAAEFALLSQAITSGLAVANTPEACDEQLGRIMLQLENLEARFTDFDDFLAQLETKREDVYEAFSSRKQSLLDERSRRADRLADSAERILTNVRRRVASLGSVDEVNTYFASDAMVARLRAVSDELRQLGDQVRAEELDGRIKAAQQEAGRALRDRLDLYDDGGETIRLGRHRFAVNTQPVDLTLVPHDGQMTFAVTGTDFHMPVTDPEFAATRQFWDQLLVSETPEVYRAEHLAASILAEAAANGSGSGHALTLEKLHEAALSEGGLLSTVREVAESRYDEGYERGVHDHDAARILEALLRLHAAAGLLRYPPSARAAAQLFWAFGADEEARSGWTTRASSLHQAGAVFKTRHSAATDALCAELDDAIVDFRERSGLPPVPEADRGLAGEYLFEELADAAAGFVTCGTAKKLTERFHRALGRRSGAGSRQAFTDDLAKLGPDLAARHQLVDAWLSSFLDNADEVESGRYDLPEAVAIELCGNALPRRDSSAQLTASVDGLLGTHARIAERTLEFRLDELLARTRRFRAEHIPAYRAYQRQRSELVERQRAELRLDEYKPQVMSAFVRNRLLDEVYLPLIGDNLAKQLGTTGESRQVDSSGLLMLISPPGYGKTTLMEYVASRLGLVFVKVNGPALGHGVTSVDPAEAPNATARQEVEKINLALEMGNNVLLYLDDIQHTNPELLQKFISLCDAQRRMEGVWNGRTRTYDLRGKRFAVCMAGNPYTEEGKRFRVPDMLANRADVWNLGDVLSGKDELFALSYIENSLTANPILAPVSTRDRADVDLLVRLARGDESAQADQLSHPYSPTELDQILSVLRKLIRVQEVVLANNQAYIASAAQADASRTEPPFQLQGSYRNMISMAARVVPVMNDDELEAMIDDHYVGEAQTLTSGAEANLLKFAELRGRMTAEQSQRWAEVKAAFLKAQALGGDDEDPMSRAVGALGLLADQVGGIEAAIERITEKAFTPSGQGRRARRPKQAYPDT